MLRRITELAEELQPRSPEQLASLCGGTCQDELLLLPYWERTIAVRWPDLEVLDDGFKESCSTFDRAMVLYYLSRADGTAIAGDWIGFRELPHGGFYNQAFQGYSGNRLAKHYGNDGDAFSAACLSNAGEALGEFSTYAFSFRPLPRILLAAVFWPGDEQLTSKASILFDSAASLYMPTDGLAILGSGLVSRLIRLDIHV